MAASLVQENASHLKGLSSLENQFPSTLLANSALIEGGVSVQDPHLLVTVESGNKEDLSL